MHRERRWVSAALVLLVVACEGTSAPVDGSGASPSGGNDGGPVADGGGAPKGEDAGPGATGDGAAPGSDASLDATPRDAAEDAPADVDLDGGTTIVVVPPVSGTPSPTIGPLHGPGLVLMGGGTDVDAAFVWMHDTLAGSATAKMGNVVVLRADDATDNAYTPYIYGLAPFQSVMTIYLGGAAANGTPATPADLAIAGYYVDRADAVFFAGGDQADYVSWKGSPLSAAIARLYARGGVVGGTSAGCAIQGSWVFDSIAADAAGGANVATADAVTNPFEPTLSFTRDLFAFPALAGVVTDMHFVTRDRLGRLGAFVARAYADGAPGAGAGVVGVGVDESNALLVDKDGKGTVVQQPGGTEAATGSGVYVFQPAGPAASCAAGTPLRYESVKVTRLTTATDSFDFAKRCGDGEQITLTIDGTKKGSPYSTDPYGTKGVRTTCP